MDAEQSDPLLEMLDAFLHLYNAAIRCNRYVRTICERHPEAADRFRACYASTFTLVARDLTESIEDWISSDKDLEDALISKCNILKEDIIRTKRFTLETLLGHEPAYPAYAEFWRFMEDLAEREDAFFRPKSNDSQD